MFLITEYDVLVFLEAVLSSLWFPFSDTLMQKLNVFFGVWWKMTHLPEYCCLSRHKHLFLLLLRESGFFGFESLRSHSSRFPASQLPHSHFYCYRLEYSINFLDSFGSFLSPLSVWSLSSRVILPIPDCLPFVFQFFLTSCTATIYIHSNRFCVFF